MTKPMTALPLTTVPLVMGWGLRIASAVPLPGAIAITDKAANPDRLGAQVTVVLAEARAVLPWPELYRWDGEALEYAPPGVARFTVTPGKIVIQPHPEADPARMIALLIATAFPALLWLRGQFVLHAACIAVPKMTGSLAFAGPSGIGKSSLARWFVDRGARLVADDSLAISAVDDLVVGQGLSAGLWSGPHSDRQFSELAPSGPPDQAARLGAIVVLTAGHQLALRPLAGMDAFAALLTNRHRPRVPAATGNQQAVMDQAGALCRQVPVHELLFDKQRHSPQELGMMIEANFGKGPARK